MLTLNQLRKKDSKLSSLTDAEIESLRSVLYEFAQLAFDVWWREKRGSKNPSGVLEVATTKHKIKTCKKRKVKRE
jgi:hypothetical protein